MPVAERVYFLGEPAAHVVAWEERRRLAAIDKRNREAVRGFLARNPGWVRHLLGLPA